jgi:hypothetical protein
VFRRSIREQIDRWTKNSLLVLYRSFWSN